MRLTLTDREDNMICDFCNRAKPDAVERVDVGAFERPNAILCDTCYQQARDYYEEPVTGADKE